MLKVNPRLLVIGTKIIVENSGKISKGQRANQAGVRDSQEKRVVSLDF